MVDLRDLKRRIVPGAQRRIVNPVGRQLPVTMLETVGRKSGEPRHTAVGGRVIGDQFWMVAEHGERSHYVLNIKANPAVRLRINGHLADRDGVPAARRRPGRAAQGAADAQQCGGPAVGSDLLTLRIDLD